MDRPIFIHVCKDRTLSYRNKFQPIFNGVALPVFSVNTVDEARELIPLVSNRQYEEHPQIPGDTWWKIDMGPGKQYLEPEDLSMVTEKLQRVYDLLQRQKADRSELASMTPPALL